MSRKRFDRDGHGAGRGRRHVEIGKLRELPPASPIETDRSDRGPDGRFLPGNRTAHARKVRPGPSGHLSMPVDPTFAPFERWGRRYGGHRRRELAAAHGGSISAGVGALIESAAMALAMSRYLAAKAAETGDPELMKRSSALANDARQNELAGWSLAALEASARPKASPIKAHAARMAQAPKTAEQIAAEQEEPLS